MNSCADAVSESGQGVLIALDVSAGAKKNAFPAGYNTWRKSIRCRVTAPAVGGRANRAVVDLVASVLGVARTDVSIVSGATSSSKTVFVAGRSRAETLAILQSSI